jgi:hypothetical protein
MQGPITVFDNNAYAGDAKIVDLQPGSERLISYAMDLAVEVAPESTSKPQELVSIKLYKGVLHRTLKHSRSTIYTVKNSGEKAKNILIEYAHDANWTLIAPKEPTEKTRDMYRFAVAAEPGKAASLTVEEERTISEQIGLVNMPDDAVVYYLSVPTINEEVKNALREIVKRKQAIAAVITGRQESERQANVIRQQQDRIRENLKVLPKESDLARTYIKKFTDQEQQVDKLQSAIDASVGEEQKLRRELDEYLMKLDLK